MQLAAAVYKCGMFGTAAFGGLTTRKQVGGVAISENLQPLRAGVSTRSCPGFGVGSHRVGVSEIQVCVQVVPQS